MQQELDASGANVWIVGVDGIGYEDTTSRITEGRDLAWLQDTAEAGVWDSWGIAYRDVVVLDGDNRYLRTFNLTSGSLSDEGNYDELKDYLAEASDGVSADSGG